MQWSAEPLNNTLREPRPKLSYHKSNFRFKTVQSLVNCSRKQQYLPVPMWEMEEWQNRQSGRVRAVTELSVSSHKETNKVVCFGFFFLGEGLKQISVCAWLDPRSQCLWATPWCHAQNQGVLVIQIYADLLNWCARPVVTGCGLRFRALVSFADYSHCNLQ